MSITMRLGRVVLAPLGRCVLSPILLLLPLHDSLPLGSRRAMADYDSLVMIGLLRKYRCLSCKAMENEADEEFHLMTI